MYGSLENGEAILNIFTNAAEQFGKTGGVAFVLAALSVLFLRKWTLAVKLAVFGVFVYLCGMVTPGILNWVIASGRDMTIPASSTQPAFWVIGMFGLLSLICTASIIAFLPTLIAFKTRKRKRKIVLVLNILIGWIPLGWNVVLFLSLMDDKSQQSI